ncbi:MAG: tellurium resistance protein [Clostridium sp. SCN 57-10]|nr:MAG: tellurium resistance protein [Clostridium sp. SCN 57-10]
MKELEPALELTFDPFSQQSAPAKAPQTSPLADAEARLTPAELDMVRNFADKIDVTDTNMVLQFGAGAQQKMASFSEAALQNVRTKDLGEVGDMISNLVGELKGFSVDDEDEKRGLFGLFKKVGNRIAMLQANYSKAETNVDKISSSLEGHQVQLFKDIAMLDEMYEKNQTNFKELSMYLLAGKRKLEEGRATRLPELIQKAEQSGLPEDAQAANDLAAMCNRFEKKLHDLELTRVISVQMAPQIRMVQNNDSLMAEKIQTTLTNTIPLWKSQMVLALGLAHSQQAMQAQREVTDMTNQLLRKNAEKLKMTTVETAKESERGIVDIETLTYTNQQLISTLDEVLAIQAEGAQKRREAQAELGRIEGELKQKLLEVKR